MIRRNSRSNVSKDYNNRDSVAKEVTQKDRKENVPGLEEFIFDNNKKSSFEDVLADQRRRHNTTQKYVQLMYNDLVKNFVKKWNGTPLLKTTFSEQSFDSFLPEGGEYHEIEFSEDEVDLTSTKNSCILDHKLYRPDEIVDIEFVNGNSYTGRISKLKMEGEGVYRWHHGSQYKGAFEDNKIQGKGSLEWLDCVQYDGDFRNGYPHGNGTMVDNDYNLFYTGQWKNGRKHGKGYCRYKTNDSYDGEWVMDKREGFGKFLYGSGARYEGQWKNGLRHGSGFILWSNKDFYSGQWHEGQMHGYGEYTWNKVFNKSFCLPREICYKGEWLDGMRDGKGQSALNSVGGARYIGEWRRDQKHGYGKIIGNNGDITEGDPLFENNIPLPTPSNEESNEENNIKENAKTSLSKTMKKSRTISKARITSVLNPVQRPSLEYYLDRLRPPEVIYLSHDSLKSGKCQKCENVSCSCLLQTNDAQSQYENQSSNISLPKSTASKAMSKSSVSPSDVCRQEENSSSSKVGDNELISKKLKDEKYWAYNIISVHISRIRKIYEVYSKIFCNGSPSEFGFAMNRLSLWQLWRDCDIHKKNLSLVQIDKYLAANSSALMENPHCPYERIEIWQLIHAFFEVSWHLYTKYKDANEENSSERLANGFHKLLTIDIFPNFGNGTGPLWGPERDLVPIDRVYKLYQSIGNPHTVRQLLKAIMEIEAFRILSSKEVVDIMNITCPSIKDSETNIIVNMDYEVTFLEFFEIFIEAGKRSVFKKKIRREFERKKTEPAETPSTASIAKEDRTNRSKSRLSEGSKSSKLGKKLVKKY